MKKIILYILLIATGVGCNFNSEKNELVLISETGKEFSLAKIEKNKATVFIFLSPECPLSQSYCPIIEKLKNKYTGKDIAFFGVFPALEISTDTVEKFKREFNLSMECLLDTEKKLTHFLQATVTPQAVIVSPEKNILYSGRIDNWAASLGEKRQVISSHDLDSALVNIVLNKEIKIKSTEPVGCIIE